ncbi:MAG: rod shape-determining protein MreD [Myxococcales bacterium]|nr:MAG: rod shape-determining protein MreD [Myxococcales bacterium]
MSALRACGLAVMLVAALILQVTVLPYATVAGVAPNLVLVVVVACALARGPEFGASVGFVAGLLMDLAPPADHVAGRWALALVLVGFLAGRVRHDAHHSVLARLVTVAACSFVGASIYAMSGVFLEDHTWPMSEMLQVVGVSVVWDVLMAPIVLPLVAAALLRLRGPQAAY